MVPISGNLEDVTGQVVGETHLVSLSHGRLDQMGHLRSPPASGAVDSMNCSAFPSGRFLTLAVMMERVQGESSLQR